MLLDPLTILILIFAVSFGFFVQTIVGFASNLVALPILLFVLPFQEAIALMSIYLFIFSAVTIYKYWEDIDKKIVIELAIGSLIGLALGIYLLKFGNPIVIKKGFGVFLIAYVIYQYVKKPSVPSRLPALGLLFGFAGGIISGLYNSGGSALVIYINNKLKNGKIIRATLIGSLGIVNFVRIPILISSKILTWEIFTKSLFILPFFFLSLYLGHKTHAKIPEALFKHILMILLAMSGISLIFL